MLIKKISQVIPLVGSIIDSLTSNSTTDAPSIHAVNEALRTNIITGQETATNEYIDGKRVYTQRFTFTTGSTANVWNEIADLENDCNLVDFYGFVIVNTEQYELRDDGFANYFQNINKILCIKYNNEYYNNKPGWVIVKYTKNS